MTQSFDDAVVGAGIVGLAHAFHLARKGRRVVVFERGERALGASIRNFGMLWPIGQPAGRLRVLALRSLEIWRGVLDESGLWHDPAGSLHLACRDDEAQVLDEFAALSNQSCFPCELLDPAGVRKRSPAVCADGLIAGLWSHHEVCVDPREIVSALPAWLAATDGVRFEFGRAVVGYDRPRIITAADFEADRIWVCAGDDLRTLYPEAWVTAGLVRCKLQMLRSAPIGGCWRMGPMLAGGLTLRHYRAFESCPTLPALRRRIAQETPEFDRFGIHVMAAQNGRGEVIVGDSHEYGAAIEPFDKRAIDDLILGYLATFLDVPGFRVAERWHGTYAKHPTAPFVVARPAPGAVAVTGLGGAGMTLSFGVAEQVIDQELGERA
jgi:FAD dependent oxidoreductase TIGR03364